MQTNTTEPLGRFGHHPDPAIDFCVEVDALDAAWWDATTMGVGTRKAVLDRAIRALEFRVGGDENAVNAKARLRELVNEINFS